jgi:hypothetical protein
MMRQSRVFSVWPSKGNEVLNNPLKQVKSCVRRQVSQWSQVERAEKERGINYRKPPHLGRGQTVGKSFLGEGKDYIASGKRSKKEHIPGIQGRMDMS